MISQKKIKVSVIIINFNNSKYIKRCLSSVVNQNFKNFEIILVDDNSTDNSIKVAKKFFLNSNFKNYKIVINKIKTKFGSYNQINCISTGLKLSKGDLILFLDSDDFYDKSKITHVSNFFKKHYQLKITFDLAYKFYSRSKKTKFSVSNRSKNMIPWPSFPSQSAISVEKKYLTKIFKKISLKKYPNIWFDFRILTKSYHDLGRIKYLNKNLTYYQQHALGASRKFKKFSKNWWKRRKEAHEFINKEVYKDKKKIYSLDFYLTSLVNLFL